MKYYFKFGYKVLSVVAPVLLLLTLAWLNVIKKMNSTHKADYFWLSMGIIYLSFLIFLILHYFSLIKLAFSRKPILEFNESYICDHVTNITFYWNDIEEVLANEAELEIRVHKYEKYFPLIKKHWLNRNYYSKNNKAFHVSLDCVKADKAKLSSLLNDYSIKAMDIEKGESH